MVRHMNLNLFPELKIIVIKFISQRFRTKVEELFIETMDSSGISEFLENQELTLNLQNYTNKELPSMLSKSQQRKHEWMTGDDKENVDPVDPSTKETIAFLQ